MAAVEPITLYCLHYLGGSGREYAALAEQLGGEYRVIPIDLAGFGDASDVAGFSVDEMARSVGAQIQAAAMPRCFIVGHSMGAKVAAVVARRAESGGARLTGLQGLVLLAGSPPCPEPMDDDKRRTMLDWFRGDPARTQSEARLYIDQNISGPLQSHFLELAIDDVQRMNLRAWRAWLTAGSREDWAERIGTLKTPTVMIAGANDAALGAEAQRKLMAPHFANGRLRVVEGATHLLPMENPTEIARLIREHAAAINE